MIISERIFSILKEKGISQKTFSEETGIAQSTISDWKRKKTNPASDKLIVICRFLGISVYELLKSEEDASNDFIIVNRSSQEYELLEAYRGLRMKDRERLFRYMEAMKNKK